MSRARASLGLVLALAAVGCTAGTGDDAMFILNNTAPPTGSGGCTLTGDMGQPFLSHGLIDTSSLRPYQMTPLIESKITAAMGQETQRIIALEGANVDLSIAGVSDGTSISLPAADQHFSSLFSGSLDPGGTVNVGFDLIPLDALAAIKAATTTASVEVLATVTVYGSLGGGRVEGSPFNYPVTVCTNCVTVDRGACPLPMGTIVTDSENACNPAQDGYVDCCHDASGALVCPATVATM